MKRPTIAIAGLTACSGCQLTLLNCEEELFQVAARFAVDYFPLATSERLITGPMDVAFVEGAVSTPADLDVLIKLRSRSHLLVAVGTCALWGGVAATKNRDSRKELVEQVYGRMADEIKTFNPGPLHHFVKVDFAITGCPPEKGELLTTLASVLRGTFPPLPDYPVCTDCRNREYLCLLMERGELCLGPLTRAGCGARCPAAGIACEGCRGPVTEANAAAEMDLLREKGFSREEIAGRMGRFCPEWDYEQRM